MRTPLPRRPLPNINIIPLVDVLTILIFFFLTAMQFRNQTTLDITPPKVESAGQSIDLPSVLISVDSKGKIYFNETEVTLSELSEAMQNVPNDAEILVVADEDSPLKQTTSILDLCKKNRFPKVKLQAR